MARTKFRSGLLPAPVDDRHPEHPGDAPVVPAEPPTKPWSLQTWPRPPAPAPDDDEGDAE